MRACVRARRVGWRSSLSPFPAPSLVALALPFYCLRRLILPPASPARPQTVEWLYAFDIHCNGFFVSFLFTHVLQFLLLPLLLTDSLAATICADLIWVVALSSYFFVTHLGYRALPFLKHTEYFLYPIGIILLCFVALVVFAILGYRINITRQMVGFYFGS